MKIRNATSDWLPVVSGDQGSVLGPVLLLINDLMKNLESSASLFEDDAKIYWTIKTEADIDALKERAYGVFFDEYI